MRVLLINPPYQTITSNVGVGHQIPLGLLMVGGPLLDAGHEIRLLDAECRRLSERAILQEVRQFAPDVVMTGHAGSTPAHPVCVRMLRAIKQEFPQLITVYGGVYPTYHAAEILENEPAIDIIVRGEGEATALALMKALSETALEYSGLRNIAGISFRIDKTVHESPDRQPIQNLDEFRVGWELIENWDEYQCFGLGRAAIIQLSRGCPHRCTYCGQFGFWVNWRHRDPVKLADEVEWLYRTHGVVFCTIADENPTTKKEVWQQFLEEVARRNLPVQFFTTIRATDIVRDADILPLYRKAGVLYVLMGIETTNPEIIRQIRKGSTARHDYQACQLLRRHGIFSVIGHIVGLGDETWSSFRTALQQLKLYDGDYLNAMYVTPHSWTKFAEDVAERGVVQSEQTKWDYRHQILAQQHMKPWQLFAAVKWLELRFHLRASKLRQLLAPRENFTRSQLIWTLWHTARVWFAEIGDFVCHTRFAQSPVALGEFQKPKRDVPLILNRKPVVHPVATERSVKLVIK